MLSENVQEDDEIFHARGVFFESSSEVGTSGRGAEMKHRMFTRNGCIVTLSIRELAVLAIRDGSGTNPKALLGHLS